MSWYVLLYFVVFDFVSIWYLFSLFLTLYSMYLCILYMSPLYITMFIYFSISLFYLSYFTWLFCVCPPFLKTVFFLSWITCNVMHVYFVFQTIYLVQVYWNKFCSVLFCSIGQKAVGKVGTHQILGNYIWWLRSRSVRSLCNWTSTETLGFTSSDFKVSFPLSWL